MGVPVDWLAEHLLVWAPSAILAGSLGIWLFYVQHQFENAYWQCAADWDYYDAALRGSSYLKLPKVMQFFTGNIGLHHVHYLNARVPNYNLQCAHDENPIFHQVPTLSLRDAMRAIQLKLRDEERGKLVTFARASLTRPDGLASARISAGRHRCSASSRAAIAFKAAALADRGPLRMRAATRGAGWRPESGTVVGAASNATIIARPLSATIGAVALAT